MARDVDKPVNQAYNYLKQVANKPKVAKDESHMFGKLLWCKLRALDDKIREIALHEMKI